ncbi:MAG: thioesterase domain-containing protein [Pirellulaceae bacterium]|nr:thioesterase domain-containing protein [Pirellulaceae bacterium]
MTNDLVIHDWLQNRIANLLNVPSESLDADVSFLELGVDSLSLVNIAGELAEMLGQDVSADEVWENDTIRLLSTHLESESPQIHGATDQTTVTNPYLSTTATRSTVRPIQPNGNRPPLFVGQSIVGGFNLYNHMLTYLDKSQPTYGLKAPEEKNQTIEQAAKTIIDGLRAVQRKGPYHLCGYCFGGLLMFEVARQLQQDGEEIGLLVLIDPPFPKPFQHKSELGRLLTLGVRLQQCLKLPLFLAQESIQQPKSLIARLRRRWSYLVYRLQHLLTATVRNDLSFLASEHFGQADVTSSVKAANAYRPGVMSGPVTLIHSREFAVTHTIEHHHWQNVVQSKCEYLVVPGLHEHVLNKESGQQIGTILNERLADH